MSSIPSIPSHYDILEIPENSNEQDIKKAYRRLSIKYHPDKTGGDAEKFRIINEAYSVLSDPQSRRNYDMERQFSKGFGGGGGGGNGVPRGIHFSNFFSGMNSGGGGGGFPDILFNMMRGMEGGFGEDQPPLQFHFVNGRPVPMNFNPMTSSTSTASSQTNPFGNLGIFAMNAGAHIQRFMVPQPIQKQIEITLIQAYNGHTMPIEIERIIVNESGERSTEKDTIYVSIPEGIDNNEHIIIKEKGHINVDKKGDIKIQIILKNDTQYRREGLDLFLEKHITLKEALCGFKFEIVGIDQKRYLIHNEGGRIISHGYRKDVVDLGMKREGKKGMLHIIFEVDFPSELSAEQVEKLGEILT